MFYRPTQFLKPGFGRSLAIAQLRPKIMEAFCFRDFRISNWYYWPLLKL